MDTKYVKADRNKAADVGNVDYTVYVEILDGGKIVATADGENAWISLLDAKLWNAEHPHLYECHVTLMENGTVVSESGLTSAKGRRNVQIRPEHVGQASAAGDFADVAGRSGANAAVGSAEEQAGAGQTVIKSSSIYQRAFKRFKSC